MASIITLGNEGDSSAIKYLIEMGATPSYEVLVNVSRFADLSTIQSIYEKDPQDVNAQAKNLYTTAVKAALTNEKFAKEILSYYLSNGAKLPDNSLNYIKDYSVVTYLLENGVKPIEKSNLMNEIITTAAQKDNEDQEYLMLEKTILELVENGARIDPYSMLMAFQLKNIRLLKELIKVGGPLDEWLPGENDTLRTKILNSTDPGIDEVISLITAQR